MMQRPRGFTLVEVLVALAAMALLATLAWQGLDTIVRTRDVTKAALERTQRISTIVVQWEQDLAAIYDGGVVPALSHDGQTLRLTRRVDGGVVVVAWAVRSGQWQRWVGPVVTRVDGLQEAWMSSQSLIGNEPGQITLLEGVSDWQVYFNRGGAWTNSQSTGDEREPAPDRIADVPPPPPPPTGAGGNPGNLGQTGNSPQTPPPPVPVAPSAPRVLLPSAVRLVVTLEGHTLTRDVMLGPSDGAGGAGAS